MVTAHTLTTRDELRDLEAEWTALWHRSPDRLVGTTHWWISAFVRHVVPLNPLRIVLLRQDGRLVFLAPLMEATIRRGPLRERWLQTLSDYRSAPATFLFETPDPALFDAFWEEIDRVPQWDCFAAWGLPSDSATDKMLSHSAHSRRMPFRRFGDADGFIISSLRGWEAFEQSRSPSLRENIRRRRKRLQQCHGPIAFRRISTPDELASNIRNLTELNARTWAGKAGGGLLAFHFELMHEAARRGHLLLDLLFANNTPIAYDLGFLIDRRVTSLAIGYDEAYSTWGPGQLLQLEITRDFFQARQADVFDLMQGAPSHKEQWATASEEYVKLYAYRRSLRGTGFWAAHEFGSRLKHTLSSTPASNNTTWHA